METSEPARSHAYIPRFRWASIRHVIWLRLGASVAIGVAISLLPVFGPYRLALGPLVVVATTVVNLALYRDLTHRRRPTHSMAIADAALMLTVVAVAPDSLALAAILFASVTALSVFWYGPLFTLGLAAAVEVGFLVVGLVFAPPLWVPAVAVIALCSVVCTQVLQTLAEGVKSTQRRFDELVNGIDAVVWEAGAGGRVDFVSANVRDVIGCEVEEFTDPGFIDNRAHPHDIGAWHYARARNAEGRGSEVHVRVRDDGTYRRIHERVKVSLLPDGTVGRHRGVLMDETRRWDAQAELRLHSDFIQGIPVALLILKLRDSDDPESLEILSLNPAGRRLVDSSGLGHGPAGSLEWASAPVPLVEVLPGIDPSWLERLAGVALTGRSFERPFLPLPGTDSIYALRAVPLPDQCIGISLEDVTKRERLAESFRHQALHDPLTGLPNRSQLHTRLEAALNDSKSTGSRIALLLVDLDQFKEVNDALGHEYGDRLLAELARRLGSKLRHYDMIARLGGDEFAVLLTDSADERRAVEVARRLISLCERPVKIGEFRFQVSASVGIAIAPEHGIDAETLMRRADGAMYRAKAAGGSVSTYSPGQDLYNVRRLELLGDLREAVGSDDLAVQYQPRVDLRTNRPVGVEALVRWHHPRHGLLPPDEFIELAEVSGTIHRLTQNVSERASAEMRDLVGRHDLSVSINLSARNLYDARLVDWVSDLLDRHRIGAGSMCFEITETQLMDDPGNSLVVLHRLRELGVRFSVDDFGTGYSSLSYLRELPIDEVKIDRTFVSDLLDDDTIVRSVIDLGHNLGLHVVAEGVENGPTMECLRELGCDSAQGYHFGAPMDADDLAGYLERAWENLSALR